MQITAASATGPAASDYFAAVFPTALPAPYAMALAACALLATGCRHSAAERVLASEPLYDAAFTGYVVCDVETGEVLASRNPDKLFTPASNTKLLTLATALAWLPNDSLPALAYRHDGDTLRLWGTAYALLGADDAAYNRRIRRRLAEHDGPVEVSLHGFNALPRFGSGWMWDDFNGVYARERSGLPVYANLATVWRTSDLKWGSRPNFLAVRPGAVLPKGRLSRRESSNRFAASAKTSPGDTLRAPLYDAQALTTQLLEDWAGRTIRHHAEPLPPDWKTRVYRGVPRDTLLRAMMLPSDNFLAEQLLLQAGLHQISSANVGRVMDSALAELFGAIPADQLRWADASGLSHYDLASPAALVTVLRELHAAEPWSRLRRVFPAGGEAGTTLAGRYGGRGREGPWLWAKTGTLRHNHCLAGYLRTDAGRLLAFSFMHNHFAGGSAAYKNAMERSLRSIKAAY